MANSHRKCRYCREYKPRESMIIINGGAYCSPDHAWLYGSEKSIQAAEKATRKKKREFYAADKGRQLELAQENFNRFIRLRDAGDPCISCGTTNPNIRWSAGHFKTVGANGALRFDEDNCHLQCWWNCNKNKSGNIAEYRPRLVTKIGEERVQRLEKHHPPVKRTLEDVIAIKKHYAAKCRELEKAK